MTDNLHRFGYDVLGPVFAAFGRLLLGQAERDGVTRLVFVARDGDFLRDVTVRLVDRLRFPSPPTLDYVHLSRLSTILPRYPHFRDAVFAEADSLFGARQTDVAGLLRYFDIDANAVSTVLRRHGMSSTTELKSPAAVFPLLEDSEFVAIVETERIRQRELLGEYLDATGLLSDPRSSLVDVGWRGSIAKALTTAFAERLQGHRLRAYYLGYWDERSRKPILDPSVYGLLSDYRRSRTVVEGSAYYAAYILEAICRAPHGTVLGLRRDPHGVVIPVLAGESRHRDVERAGERWREPIRAGILEFIEAHADRYLQGDSDRVRRDAQRRLFRLAFFPTQGEIQAVSGLAHTEGHAPDWARPLIDPVRPSPLRSPRRWLAGLASPWRSGYVMATGGLPLALTFIAVESLLLAFPSIRRGMRKLALAVSRSP
jgi:preprotein translocase subunit Sec61beta